MRGGSVETRNRTAPPQAGRRDPTPASGCHAPAVGVPLASVDSSSVVVAYLQFSASALGSVGMPSGFISLPAFFLRHGRHWKSSPLPGNIDRGKAGFCFQNAAQLAIDYPGELTYVEGYANTVIPIHHAWCVDRDGNVVDPTWEYDPEREYFGIPVKIQFLRRTLCERKVWGLFDPYPTHSHLADDFDASNMIEEMHNE